VWERDVEYSPAHQDYITSWTLDKRKLHGRLTQKILDPEVAQVFHHNKERFLDHYFGKGTFKAYAHKPEYDFHQEKHMGTFAGSTFTNTSTTSSTNSDFIYWAQEEARTAVQKTQYKNEKAKAKSRYQPYRAKRTVVPFKNNSDDSLVDCLQQHFDRWAGEQLALVTGTEVIR
jgi:hypothetical protein